MKLSQHFRIWLSRRGALALFITLLVLLGMFQMWREQPQPRISHVLGPSTQQVDVLWLKQEIFTKVASNDSSIIYAMPITRGSLRAIDTSKGNTKWQVELPLERGGGADSLLADKNAVFVVTSIFIDAYVIETGELKWSTKLGGGHVPIVSQIDSDIVRVYYGDKLYEIDSETGEILNVLPKKDVVWISGNIVFHEPSTNLLGTFNKQTGEPLWTNDNWFYVVAGQEPKDVGRDSLIVGFIRGICALNLRSGEYNWCHPEIDISYMAIDYQSQLGYAMRKDLVLLTIDLKTGNVLGETRFLSSEPIDEQIGFMSSITFSNGVIVVSFSDSGQTFGLSINQSSKIQTPRSTP